MAGFPLFMSNKYYNIQDDKMYFMIYVTAVFAAVTAVMGIVLFIKKRKNTVSAGAADKNSTAEATGSADNIIKAARLRGWVTEHTAFADRFALCFFLVLIISTACSKWSYEAFWGNMGRYQGLYLWIFYMAAYLMISRFYTPKQWHMDIFMLVGLIVCGWGVLDFFYKSPFGWQESARDYMAFDFSSTIGNVNLLTGFEGIMLIVSSAMFIGNRDAEGYGACALTAANEGSDGSKKTAFAALIRDILYYATAFAAMMGLICGFSDNAVISVGCAVCFLPFFAFGNVRRLIRYIGLLAGYAGAFVLIRGLTASGMQTVSYEHWGMLLGLCTEHGDKLQLLFAVLLAVCIAAELIYRLHESKRHGNGIAAEQIKSGRAANTSAEAEAEGIEIKAEVRTVTEGKENEKDENAAGAGTDRRGPTRWLRCIWAMLGIIAALIIIYIFYDANTGGHPELYAPYSNLLIFDSNWGTRRGFNWHLAFGYIRDFPLFNKLFGSGPETYPIYTYSFDYYNMVNAFDEVYDSPHNEWLQYLFTTGILGFISYYGWVVSSVITGCRAGIDGLKGQAHDHRECAIRHLMGTAFAYGALTYTLVSFVNISAPCLTPMVILCMGAAAAAGRRTPTDTDA